MNRRPFPFRSLAVAATTDAAASTSAAAMSYRPYLREGRPQIRRNYCDKPSGPGDYLEFVSGDSHRGFRPSYNAVPPPPQYVTGQQFHGPGYGYQRPGPPVAQQLHGPRPYKHPQQVGPPYGNHQPFRPQKMQQQFRPRATKPPDYREWEYANPGVHPQCERFSVLSYNILADYLATDHWHKLYYHIPRYMMDWNWRKRNIIFELGLWSADILCFQEVDRFQDIEAELNPRGYYGIWKMRTGDPADGCAIFWRVSRFKLLHEESIEFNKLCLRDNVAQICVFESLNGQSKGKGASTLSASSGNSNRVVVCNIHVLYNPRRGEIKLGQIRVLLDRAHAVSKLWDDAQIVICGDFNCTPKSPIYNFIKEQKLDLSELARDKVSGQASAEIRPLRPAYPDFRTRAADCSTQASAVDCEKIEKTDLPSDAQKLACLHMSTNAPSTGSYSKPGYPTLNETSALCNGEEHRSRIANDLPSHNAADSSAIMSNSCTTHDAVNQSVSSVQDYNESPVFPDRDTNQISVLESSSEEIQSEATEGRKKVESDSQTPSETPDDLDKNLCLRDIHSDDPSKASKPMYNLCTAQLEGPSKKLAPNSPDFTSSNHVGATVSVSAPNENNTSPSGASASCGESISADIILDEKFEALSFDEVVDGVAEDADSFLAELHYAGQSPTPADSDSSSTIQKLQSHGEGILNQSLQHESLLDRGYSPFNPSAWTPADLQITTGSTDCKVMEHPLKLTSAYAEVKSPSGLRDSSGEPFVTSYHRLFSGTVDYIWHSDGLKPVKVLAPIPKDVMHQTQGFPTKKWGSDHIALVSEFAFTKDVSSENSNR